VFKFHTNPMDLCSNAVHNCRSCDTNPMLRHAKENFFSRSKTLLDDPFLSNAIRQLFHDRPADAPIWIFLRKKIQISPRRLFVSAAQFDETERF